MLERLADTLREAGKDEGQGFPLTADMTALLGCSVEDLRGTLTALGYRRIQKGPDPEKAEGERWDRRRRKHAGPRPSAERKPVVTAPPPDLSDSPFAALAALRLTAPPERKPRPARKRRRKAAGHAQKSEQAPKGEQTQKTEPAATSDQTPANEAAAKPTADPQD